MQRVDVRTIHTARHFLLRHSTALQTMSVSPVFTTWLSELFPNRNSLSEWYFGRLRIFVLYFHILARNLTNTNTENKSTFFSLRFNFFEMFVFSAKIILGATTLCQGKQNSAHSFFFKSTYCMQITGLPESTIPINLTAFKQPGKYVHLW